MRSQLTKRPCPLCGVKNNLQGLFHGRFEQLKKDYVVSECRSCGFIHQNPSWGEKDYDNLYADHVYDPSNHKFYPSQIERYRGVAAVIGNLPLFQSRILDYGCYDGSFMEWLKKFTAFGQQTRIIGYDIFLKNISNADGFYNSLKILLEKESSFDVVVMSHVLEHIFNPLKVLGFINDKLLKDKGYLVIEVPDASFIRNDDCSPVHIQHLNYFTPQTMVKLGNAAGLPLNLLKTLKNYDTNRDPSHPTLIAIFQKDLEFLSSGKLLKLKAEKNNQQLKKKLLVSCEGRRVGFVGCGDQLLPTIKLLKGKTKMGGLFDNNKNIWGSVLLGHTIEPVEKTKDSDCDVFVLCTLNQHNTEQLLSQLSEFIDKNKLITLLNFQE